jgi:hypothetical protein
MTSLLPGVVHSLVEGGGALARRVDLVIIGVLGLLLLEYDLLRVYFGGGIANRLRPMGIAIGPLLVAVIVVIAHRWRVLSR